MAPNGTENYEKRNMTLQEAMDHAEYCREHMLTGENTKYVWKQGGKQIDASWQ